MKYVICDNDRKLQSKSAQDAWAKFGFTVCPGAGMVTNKDVDKGYPLDTPLCMPLDQSIHNAVFMIHGDLEHQPRRN